MARARERAAKSPTKRGAGGKQSSASPFETSPAAFERACQQRNYDAARQIIERLIARDPGWVDARVTYAQLLYEHYGEVDRPRAMLEALSQEHPDQPRILSLLATLCAGVNDQAAAAAYAERCIARFPETPDAYQVLQRARPELGPQLATRIAHVLANRTVTDRQRLVFHTVLGRIAEKEGDLARAFEQFGRANRLHLGRYDPSEIAHYFHEIASTCDAAFFTARRKFGAPDARPVFIIGLPRSGSTLLERILSRHPRIDAAGERSEAAMICEELRRKYAAPQPGQTRAAGFWAEIAKHDAKSAGARYVSLVKPAIQAAESLCWLDKMPGNFMLVGFLKAILPNARFIHARRNPLDVAVSCYLQSFQSGHPYAQTLPRLAHYIAWHRRLMAHWRRVLGEDLLEVDYEDVVEDLEGQARRSLAHLGQEWHSDCLSPQQSNRPVLTASIAQVRQPIYRGSVARWRRYEPQLAPLFEAWRAMGDDVYQDVMSAVRE
ncbi:MAG: sulfotransferase [Neomegalonema sp.]|nr:sulfotransferase [Neomegalonema sp.]